MSLHSMLWAMDQAADRDLTDGQKLLLIMLADHADDAGECWPGLAGLCQCLGRCERTVRNRLVELEDKGLIERLRRRRENGSLTSNLYRLAVPPNDHEPVAPAKSLYVYFAKSAEKIKVGISTDPEKRMAGLSASRAAPVVLLGFVPGDRALQRRVHEQLATHRSHGEWFHDNDAVRAALGRLTSGTHVAGGASGTHVAGPEPPMSSITDQGQPKARDERQNYARPAQLDLDGGAEVIDLPTEKRKPSVVGGVSVGRHEHDGVDRVMAAFSEAAGARFTSAEFRAKVIRRIREHPELSVEEHLAVVERNLAVPWWSGKPTPSVVYGSAEQFERALACDGKKKLAGVDAEVAKWQERSKRWAEEDADAPPDKPDLRGAFNPDLFGGVS